MRSKVMLYVGLAALLIAVALTYLLKPVTDADFFWHVATGHWIVEHRALPLEDPFSYTSPQLSNPRQQLILGGYWLTQIIYSNLYGNYGDAGIIFLRFVLLFAMTVGLVRLYKSHNIDNLAIIFFVALFITALLPMFSLERPHAMTFLLFLLVIILLKEYDNRTSYCISNTLLFGLILSVLFLFWTFLHPGYVVGIIVLTSYFIHVLINSYYGRKNKIFHASILFALPLICTVMAWPELIDTKFFVETLSPTKKYLLFNYEQMSLYEYYKNFENEIVLFYFLLMIFSLATLYFLFKLKDYFLAVLLLGTLFISFLHIRYVPFFLIVFFICLPVNRFIVDKNFGRFAFFTIVSIISIYFSSFHVDNLQEYKVNGLVRNDVFPVNAANYILQEQYRDEIIFNDAVVGGYLAWKLFPRHQIFIDGRTLNEGAYIDSLGFSLGGGYWRNVVDKYNISMILLTKSGSDVKYDDLVAQIENDREWTVAFRDEFSSVFRRATVRH